MRRRLGNELTPLLPVTEPGGVQGVAVGCRPRGRPAADSAPEDIGLDLVRRYFKLILETCEDFFGPALSPGDYVIEILRQAVAKKRNESRGEQQLWQLLVKRTRFAPRLRSVRACTIMADGQRSLMHVERPRKPEQVHQTVASKRARWLGTFRRPGGQRPGRPVDELCEVLLPGDRIRRRQTTCRSTRCDTTVWLRELSS